jgi:maltokinase
VTDPYLDQLATYLGRQRWFAGKDRAFSVTGLISLPPVSTDPLLVIELAKVAYDGGPAETYQVPTLYSAEVEPGMDHALIGIRELNGKPRSAYDAAHAKTAAQLLLRAFRDQHHDDQVSFVTVQGAELPDESAQGSMMTAEQSNTSIAYGNDALLKIFRRVSDGRNPDVDIHHSLTVGGSEHVAPLLGWYEGNWSDEGVRRATHLGMLQAFLRTATDGWYQAQASVRDFLVDERGRPSQAGGDFAGEAERLGEATAEVHADLADAFGTVEWGADAVERVVDTMLQRVERMISDVSALTRHRDEILRVFETARTTPTPVLAQRIHGDLHLGQTLRTVKGWKFIDFEGEPNRPLAERSTPDSPMRDVAGMLRSFDYAAGAARAQFSEGDDHLVAPANAWTARNQRAFLRGYSATSTLDLDALQPLLRAYEVDKAVYEVGYESGNRPTWVAIPLHAIEQIATEVA